MRTVIIAVSLALILVCLSLYGASCGWFGLSLKAEVRPLEAVSLAVNLLIALFLQRFFATRMTDVRAKKNVLIDAAKDLLSIFDDLQEKTFAFAQKSLFSAEDAESKAIISGFRRASNGITALEKSIEMSRLNGLIDLMREIRSGYFDLKSAATGGSFPKEYPISQRNRQERLFQSVTLRVRELIFKINDAH